MSYNQIEIKKEDNKLLSVGGNMSAIAAGQPNSRRWVTALPIYRIQSQHFPADKNINVLIPQVPQEHRSDTIWTSSQKSVPKKNQRKGTNVDNGIELTFLLKHFDHFTCKEYSNIITETEYSVITVKLAVVH